MGDLRVGWINVDSYQTPQDTRLHTQAVFARSAAGPLLVRSGLLGGPDAAQLSGATAMEADLDVFQAIIMGGQAGDQGAYPVTLPAQKRLTFTAGLSTVDRVDRVAVQVMDADYDDTGTHDGDVVIVPGDAATGAAAALPPDSLLLYEVTVPAGASAGGSGIPWASAVADRRVWTTTAGGILPVADAAGRDAIAGPAAGTVVARLDTGVLEMWTGQAWQGPSPVGALAAVQSMTPWPAGASDGTISAVTIIGGGTAAQRTTPMQVTVTLDPARTYECRGWIGTIDTNTGGTWYRVCLKRTTGGGDATAGTNVAIGYGYLPAANFGSGGGMSPTGYLSGLSGSTTIAMTLEVYNGSGLLRSGGHTALAVYDVGPASLLTNG